MDTEVSEGGVAVLYAAKSTEDTHGSIPTQLADGRELAASLNRLVLGEYKDESASAYSGNRGPELAKAMVECERLSALGESVALIVQHSDRLARGDGKQARHLVEYVLWALKSDIELRSVQNPEMLAGGDKALLMGVLAGTTSNEESDRKSKSCKDGMTRRAERGLKVGGVPCYAYRWGSKVMIVVEHEAAIVVRVFREYTEEGRSQRAIAKALNADGSKTSTGSRWGQSAISKMLANVTYMGKIAHQGTLYDGAHKPLVSEETWRKAQRIRAAQKLTGGRNPAGKHLLTRGVFRCKCGAAMLPRKTKMYDRYERYACAARIFDSSSCDQPSLHREKVDEPLLEALLDGYINLDKTQKRVADRNANALSRARMGVEQGELELGRIDRRLTKIMRGWQDEVIDDAEYASQRNALVEERAGQEQELEQARMHVVQIEEVGTGDAEQILLEYLAALKKAAATSAGKAADLDGLRRTIRLMFAAIELVPGVDGPAGVTFLPSGKTKGEIFQAAGPREAEFEEADQRYWLLPRLKPGFIRLDDERGFTLIGQALPVPLETDPASKETGSVSAEPGADHLDDLAAVFGPIEVRA